MNNNGIKNGSIVIMVLMLMFVVVAVIHLLLQTNFYLISIARSRANIQKLS